MQRGLSRLPACSGPTLLPEAAGMSLQPLGWGNCSQWELPGSSCGRRQRTATRCPFQGRKPSPHAEWLLHSMSDSLPPSPRVFVVDTPCALHSSGWKGASRTQAWLVFFLLFHFFGQSKHGWINKSLLTYSPDVVGSNPPSSSPSCCQEPLQRVSGSPVADFQEESSKIKTHPLI